MFSGFFPLERLYRNPKNRARVILSLAKDLLFFRTRVESELVFRNYKTKRQILRRSTPQNDTATQSLTGEDEDGSEGDPLVHPARVGK
jgi:hypothetical protein